MRHILLGLGIAALLSGCGDPLRDVARLGDVEVASRAALLSQTPNDDETARNGLFGRLLNRQANDPTNSAIQSALAQTDSTTNSPEAVIVPTSASSEVAPAPAAPRRGLFGLFGSNNRATPRNGPDTADVAGGSVMPFGQIARVCGLSNNELGTLIEGDSGFRIYDTIPNTTAKRPFYITGFDDNCARTFTGAVVVTGDVETHEFVRYRPSNERIPYSTTDNAYEALKASVCRVGRGQPCGDRLNRMDSNTHFITVYDFFGGTFNAVPTEWAQILVHDGDVLAMSVMSGQ